MQARGVKGPFDVLRRAKGRLGPAGEGRDLLCLCGGEDLWGLGAGEGGADAPVLAIRLARDQPLSQPRDGREDDNTALPGDRIGGKGHACGLSVDHPLHDDGGAFGGTAGGHLAIGGNTLGKAGAPDLLCRLPDIGRRDIQHRLELARMAVGGAVFLTGRAAHGKGAIAQRGESGVQPIAGMALRKSLGADHEKRGRVKAETCQPGECCGLAADLIHLQGSRLRHDIGHQKTLIRAGANPASA